MEECYDLVRHDEIVKEIQHSADVETMLGDAHRGITALVDDPDGIDFDSLVRKY